MLKWFVKKINNKKGFTLVELVVVIAILGILAAVAVPRFTGSVADANRNAVEANLRTIDGAIAMYEANTGTVPTGFDALITGENATLQSQPVGPDKVVYIIVGGRGAVQKGEAGSWFTATGTEVGEEATAGFMLPLTW